MARDIEQVNNAVMTNAESVGQELRVRSQAMAKGCVGGCLARRYRSCVDDCDDDLIAN